jgi:hypothetical protein
MVHPKAPSWPDARTSRLANALHHRSTPSRGLGLHIHDDVWLTTMQCHQRCTGSRPASTCPCWNRAACCRNCVTGILAWCFRLTCRLRPSAHNKFMLSRTIILSRCGVAVWRLQLLQDLRHPLVPPCRQVPAALRDLPTARHQEQPPSF